MQNLNVARVKEITSKFEEASIMVVGDLILDEFIWGQVNRISPEAPVPVVNVKSKTLMPGGAANVSVNIHSLGGMVVSIGAVGNDREGEVLSNMMGSKGMDVGGIVIDSSQPTSLKSRIIAHSQQVVRVDREGSNRIGDEVHQKLCESIRKRIKDVDAVILEDYDKGVIDQRLVSEVVNMATEYGKIVVVDPKRGHMLDYTGVTMMTPNHDEAADAAGFNNDVEKTGRELMRKWQLPQLLITLGEEGMVLFERDQDPIYIDTVAREIYDVSGAGDTVIASLTLALVSGATPREAAIIANHAAGIVVGKLGTATTDRDELIDSFMQVQKV